MSITRASRIVTTIACYSLVIVGSFDNLDTLATIIASTINPGHLHVALLQYPAGCRLQITSDDNTYPQAAHDLVEHYAEQGMAVTIANGEEPLPVYLYKAGEPEPPLDEAELPF
jgi:hypothetical protein